MPMRYLHAMTAGGGASEGYFPRGKSMLRMGPRREGGGSHVRAARAVHRRGEAVELRGHQRTHPQQADAVQTHHAHRGEVFEAVGSAVVPRPTRCSALVHRMHERVVGELPEDPRRALPGRRSGRGPDPQLMLWTVAVIADSAFWFYEHLVRTPQ